MNDTRNYNLDLIKTVSIILVCMTHFNNLRYVGGVQWWRGFIGCIKYIWLQIPVIAVPLFFVINGYLILNKEINLKKHIVKTIMLPIKIMSWAGITYIILSLVYKHDINVSGLLTTMYNSSYTGKEYPVSFWFFVTLFFIYLFYPLVKKIFDSNDKTIVYYMLSIIFIFTVLNNFIGDCFNAIQSILGIYICNFDNYIFFNRYNCFNNWNSYSLVYFILGGIVGRDKEKIKEIVAKNKCAILIASFTLLLLGIMCGYLYTISINTCYNNVWNGYPSLFTVGAVLGIFLLTVNQSYYKYTIAQQKVLKLIGSNTMCIYFLQTIIGTCLLKIYNTVPNRSTLIGGILFGLIVFLISLLVSIIIKKIPLLKKITVL